MSRYPQLPTCPAWCREEHGQQQHLHRRAIDIVQRMPPSQIEVEVNLCEDPTGPYVQVAISDYEIPEEQFPGLRHVFYRVPLDLANAWSHVANGLDARGALEVGQHIEYALDIYRTHQACPYEWCVSDHTDPAWEHAHISQTIKVPGMTVRRHLVTPVGGEPNPSPSDVVQIHFTREADMRHEMTPEEALNLSDVFKAIHAGEWLDAMADAVHTVASLPSEVGQATAQAAPSPPRASC